MTFHLVCLQASTQSRGGCDHMAIPIDDVDPLPSSLLADHKRHLLPNPYNRLNQRCHSTLHCPCCFFLCLLCCLPAVYFMVLSDLEFDFGSLLKARRYGRRTTKLYFAGATLAVTLLVTCVVCVTFFLPHTLVGPWSLWLFQAYLYLSKKWCGGEIKLHFILLQNEQSQSSHGFGSVNQKLPWSLHQDLLLQAHLFLLDVEHWGSVAMRQCVVKMYSWKHQHSALARIMSGWKMGRKLLQSWQLLGRFLFNHITLTEERHNN